MSKLKEMRQKAGLSQSQLAERAKMNVRTLQHYEQTNSPRKFDSARIDTILRVCLVLDCKISDLIENPEWLELLKKYEA